MMPHRSCVSATAHSVIAAALLLGGASAAGAHTDPVKAVYAEVAQGQFDKGIALGEGAVAKKPRAAPLRAALGYAYLKAGRFDSAASALADATTLGDTSARTALILALAEIAANHNHEAVAVLDASHDAIAPADLGLALALAGDSGRGVTLLTGALRGGDASPKLRQNLAYAFALDGKWAEARLMASSDVPAGEVDALLARWAKTAAPELYRERVAELLKIAPAADPGMPARLALAAPAEAPALAVATPPPAANPAPAPQPDAAGELPPVASTPAPTPLLATNDAPALPPVADLPAPAVAQPVVAPAPVLAMTAPPPAPAAMAKPHAAGTHVVQLGAFLSQANAERAKHMFATRDAMRDHTLTITQATVNGRTFWRVAAGGFSAASAAGTCGTLRHHGGACFAYAAKASAPALAMAGPTHRR